MALERKYKLDWNDIANLFSALNTERVEFKYEALTYPNPNSKKRTKTSESVEALVDGIEDMLSNDYVASQASGLTVSDIVIPQPKDRMKPDVFNQIRDKIETLQNVNFGFNGAGFNGGFNPSSCFDEGCFTNSGFGFTRGCAHSGNGSVSGCDHSGSAGDSSVSWEGGRTTHTSFRNSN